MLLDLAIVLCFVLSTSFFAVFIGIKIGEIL